MNSQLGTVLYFVVLIGIFYFLIIRPQMTRQKEASALLASLEVGDQVVTGGGIYGTIRSLTGDDVELEIADGVLVRATKAAVVRKLED